MATVPEPIKAHARRAWKPQVADGDGALTASKFSGKPLLAMDEQWPECRHCGKPMQLFLQLNLDEVPEAVGGEFGEGILQMFYCTSGDPFCEVECEAFFPFADSVFVRLVQPEAEAHEYEPPAIEGYFPSKVISGWVEMEDYPNYEEAKEQGIELTEAQWDDWVEQQFPLSGDKLAGWPNWVQGIEYPCCPVCNERMRLVFQLDSEDNLPFMFGDVGCGHITQCRTHKSQLAFGWACA